MTCHLSRRRWLAAATAAVASAPCPAPAAGTSPAFARAASAATAAFIDLAFQMRERALSRGDQGYGAVVVKDRRVVGQAPSRVVTNCDPTAHAEMEAIRDATRRLATRDLSGCTIYSSSPPCPMCEAAAYWANVDRLVFGRAATDRGAPRLTRC